MKPDPWHLQVHWHDPLCWYRIALLGCNSGVLMTKNGCGRRHVFHSLESKEDVKGTHGPICSLWWEPDFFWGDNWWSGEKGLKNPVIHPKSKEASFHVARWDPPNRDKWGVPRGWESEDHLIIWCTWSNIWVEKSASAEIISRECALKEIIDSFYVPMRSLVAGLKFEITVMIA